MRIRHNKRYGRFKGTLGVVVNPYKVGLGGYIFCDPIRHGIALNDGLIHRPKLRADITRLGMYGNDGLMVEVVLYDADD